MNAVLEEMQKNSKDEETYILIEKLKKRSIHNKKEYALENAPFSLLTAGWGFNTKSKIQNTKIKQGEKEKGNWEQIQPGKSYSKIRFLIYKKDMEA